VCDATTLQGMLTSQTVKEETYTVQPGDVLGTIAVKHDMTTAELRSLNPRFANTDMIKAGDVLIVQRPKSMLQVKVIKTIYYTEKIDYTTKTVYRSDKPVTYSKVTTKGVEGSQNVTADITYIDGVEMGRAVTKRLVTKQPVTKVVEVGTKRVNSSSGSAVQQGDGVTRGSMTWPVPVCHSMSRGYKRGHYALDIANGPVKVLGKPCVAADGGVVIQASIGWNGGYGNVIKIQHSNGLVTVYAHLQSIKVVKGQRVSRGQTIGLVGNSGRSTGPHLHFEVIKNGVKVNPLNYVKP
jgi:murein DD-endopeptidase MepM/ murein hydrolase activator NlpD